MPELPAMENFRRSIEQRSLGKKIVSVSVKKDRVVEFNQKTIEGKAVGQNLLEATRHGKYVFVRVGARSRQSWLVFHCGMTGYFTYPTSVDDEEKIDKAKLVLQFSNREALVFYDPRRFGKVELIEKPETFIEQHKLGIDAAAITGKQFRELISSSGKSLKSLFLDQSNIAGIGNVYGDEIPFHAKLSPKRSGDELTKTELSHLFKSFAGILKTATDKKAYLDHWDMLPKSWLVHYREDGATCPRCSHTIKSYKAGGRDGYYCPGCQK